MQHVSSFLLPVAVFPLYLNFKMLSLFLPSTYLASVHKNLQVGFTFFLIHILRSPIQGDC